MTVCIGKVYIWDCFYVGKVYICIGINQGKV